MNRRSLVRNLAAAGAGFFVSRGAAWSDEDFVIHSEVRMVLLDVSVKDSQGHEVDGLSATNFRVEEDGRPQEIKAFDHDDAPVTLGLLVDESRSMTPTRGYVLVAAEALIDESNRQDEIFVLNFNDSVEPGLPPGTLFSGNIVQLHEALYHGTPQGRTALNDAIVAGLMRLKEGRRAKKTLVLISDGGDNASAHTRKETLDMVERSLSTIYSIGLYDPDDADRDPGLLRQFAHISGGEAYFPMNVKEMLPICHTIARDIRARYTLGYLPPAQPQGSARGLRHIHVSAAAPGTGKLTTRTRTSYLYEEAPPPKRK